MTAIENCKLLYLTSKHFFKLFGEMEINKIKDFREIVDLKEIENKVRSTWMHKKLMHR